MNSTTTSVEGITRCAGRKSEPTSTNCGGVNFTACRGLGSILAGSGQDFHPSLCPVFDRLAHLDSLPQHLFDELPLRTAVFEGIGHATGDDFLLPGDVELEQFRIACQARTEETHFFDFG